MRLKLLALLLSLPLSAISASDDVLERNDFELVLVPSVLERRLPGGVGSSWITELWVRNSATEPVVLGQGEPFCPPPFCGAVGFPFTIEPRTTVRPRLLPPLLEAGLFYVERRLADRVFFSLRIRDETRRQQSAGTQIPVVREHEMYSGPLELLNVPLDSGRVNLRVYEIDNITDDVVVRVSVLPMQGEHPLATFDVLLYPRSRVTAFPAFPSEAIVYNLANLIPMELSEPARIRIEPLVAGRFWAYATITNDTTNEVTVAAPD